MITGDLDLSVDKGEPVGILIAVEFPIYGRLGYGCRGPQHLEARRVRVHARLREAEGTVELVDEATSRKEAPAVYERFRAQQPGAIGRDDRWWDIVFRIVKFPSFPIAEKFWVLCRIDGARSSATR